MEKKVAIKDHYNKRLRYKGDSLDTYYIFVGIVEDKYVGCYYSLRDPDEKVYFPLSVASFSGECWYLLDKEKTHICLLFVIVTQERLCYYENRPNKP